MEKKDLDVEEYLKRFRLFLPDTLFPPNWSALKEKRCPLCGNLLKFPRNNTKIIYCNGKKHAKRFVISAETMAKLST